MLFSPSSPIWNFFPKLAVGAKEIPLVLPLSYFYLSLLILAICFFLAVGPANGRVLTRHQTLFFSRIEMYEYVYSYVYTHTNQPAGIRAAHLRTRGTAGPRHSQRRGALAGFGESAEIEENTEELSAENIQTESDRQMQR